MQRIIPDKFEPLTTEMAAAFEPYRLSNQCGDTTFALLYAWKDHFTYAARRFGPVLAVAGFDIKGEPGCILLREGDAPPDEALRALLPFFQKLGKPLAVEYVSRHELEQYAAAAKRLGMSIASWYEEKYSDYIYDTEEFISVSGGKNKRKRTGLNYLERYHPQLRYVGAPKDPVSDCMAVFDGWCSGRECEECFFGCERRAFSHFLEIYDPSVHRIGLICDGDKPVSFAVTEQISQDTVCCYFQKNAVQIRGLTYWLHREMTMEDGWARYLNFGEDMGVPGIREDKSLYHPCRKENKYTVVLREDMGS